MKYYLIAGEASGDLHGSNLALAILRRDPHAQLRGWGGDLMTANGVEVVKHYRELAFMGFAEVLMNLRTILRNLKACKADIQRFKPDVVIYIDYPGFNLRIAPWAKKQGFTNIWYISPQVWAWSAGRVKIMKRCLHKMLVILPFEPSWYEKNWQWSVTYVGHPLVEVVHQYQPRVKKFHDWPLVAVLPGSRRQEICAKLPEMLRVTQAFPQYHFVVAMAPGIEESFYQPYLSPYKNVSAVKGLTYDLLSQAKAAMVASGTATLETALFGVPEVVCYKGSPVSFAIARRLVKIKYISLVNLILDRPVVKELIQHQMNAKYITAELRRLLEDEQYRANMIKEFSLLKEKLIAGGHASEKAAEAIISLVRKA